MSPQSRTRSKQKGSTPGCCTTSRARTRLPTAWRASGGNGGHLATRRWFYLIPASGAAEADRARHRAAQPGSPARHQGAVRGSRAAGRRVEDHAVGPVARGDGIFARQRHPLRVARRCRHHRDGARGRRGSRDAAAISSSASTASGTTPRSSRTARLLTSSIASRIAAFEAVTQRLRDNVATTEFDIQQLMAGWFVDEGAGRGIGAKRLGAGERGQPALPADRGAASRDSSRRAAAAGSVGQVQPPAQRVCGHHVGGLHRPPRAGPHDARVCRHRRARGTRRCTSCRRPRARGGRCAASSWTAPRDR